MKRHLLVAAFVTLAAAAVFAAAVTESPEGQQNVEVLAGRNQNALPTPAANWTTFTGNNGTLINTVPTPAADECVFGDQVSDSASDSWTLRCKSGLTFNNVKLDPGQAVASKAPLYLQSGPLLPTPEAGAMEYLDHTLYFTTYLVRRSVVLAQSIVTSDTTVANDSTEQTIYTIPMAATYLTEGKVILPKLSGIYSAQAPATFTLRLKYAGATVISLVSNSGNASNAPWDVAFRTTIRSAGVSGTAISGVHGQFNTVDVSGAATSPTTINTTVDNTMTVTVQWNTASASNSFKLQQGFTECVQ